MAKLKLRIDLDIDFGVAAQVEVFGFEAVIGVRRKKVVGQDVAMLAKEQIVDLTPEDYAVLTAEESETSEQ
jgi:hypothetical protein